MTPLKKHRGHPGWLALAVLAATGTAVWLDARAKPASHGVVTTYSIAPKLPEAQQSVAAAAATPAAITALETVRPVRRERVVIASGFVTFDASRTDRVVAPFDGMLVKTRRSSVGRFVRAGEALGVLYSREVYATTEELLDALAKVRPQPEIDALRYRLMRAGMPMQTVSKIERARMPTHALPVIARVSGRVVNEPVQWWPMVRAQTPLFTVTEPGRYTVYVELLDADAARTPVGMPARLTIEGVRQPVTATVAHVWRRSDGGKRTVRFDVYLPRVRVDENTPVTARFDYGH